MPKYAPAPSEEKNVPTAFAENSPLPAMANPALNQSEIPIRAGDKAFAEPADSFAEYTDFRQNRWSAASLWQTISCTLTAWLRHFLLQSKSIHCPSGCCWRNWRKVGYNLVCQADEGIKSCVIKLKS
ncbi:MAG: hypothetical protein OXG39_12430 [Chloroflexi bacterium]|nr:hypothetical protein [Chloroflexota bacterium]